MRKKMENDLCFLFDMDGVMIDTEPQYDVFWKHAADKYNVGIPNFERIIKGTTLPNILKKYFSEYTESEVNTLVDELEKFEAGMEYPEIPGSVDFVKMLKEKGFKVGLVTSSTAKKLEGVYRDTQFDKLFDTIVYAERIIHGKPAPDCFLLAAKDLNVDPKNCIVFEDSFAGIEAGTTAGMKVIGLATTHPAESLDGKCSMIIPNFKKLQLSDIIADSH